MNGFAWPRDGWLVGTGALLETLWVWPWLNFLLATNPPTATQRVSFLWVLALLAVPALAGRWLEGMARRVWRLALLMGGLALGLAFVKQQAVPDVPLLDWRWLRAVFAPWLVTVGGSPLGLVLFLWVVAGVLLARGVWLGLGEVTSDGAKQWFLGGLVLFMVLFGTLAVWAVPAYASDQVWLGPALAAYFVLGLTWLALVRRRALARDARYTSGDATWLLLCAGVGVVLLALALLGLALANMLGGLADSVTAVGDQLQAGVVAFARQVLTVWIFLTSLIPSFGPAEPPVVQPALTPTPTPVPDHTTIWQLPGGSLPFEVPWGVLLLVGIVVMAALWVLLWARRPRAASRDEERTSLWSWRLLWQQLEALWRALHRRRARISAGGVAVADAAPPPGSVRGLYRAALARSARHGRPRPVAATPLEFEPALEAQLSPDLARELTEAYVEVRYGGRALPEADVARLRARWEKLRGRMEGA